MHSKDILGSDLTRVWTRTCAAATLAGRLRDHVVAAGSPRRGIVPLRVALEKVAPSPEYITPMHAMLFQW